jgi:hypothetical protein
MAISVKCLVPEYIEILGSNKEQNTLRVKAVMDFNVVTAVYNRGLLQWCKDVTWTPFGTETEPESETLQASFQLETMEYVQGTALLKYT